MIIRRFFLFLSLVALTFSEARTLVSDPGTPMNSADLFFALKNDLQDSSFGMIDIAPHIWSLWDSSMHSGSTLNESAQSLRRLARLGDPQSQIAYGICLQHGEGVPIDRSKAAKYFKKAADQNSPIGHVMYGTEIGVNNSRLGVKHVTTAANLGDPYAQFLSGLLLRQRATNDIMRRQAADLFLRAALQNHTLSQVAYGVCCMFGVGITQDREKGAYFFALAQLKARPGTLFICGLALWPRGSEHDLKLALGFFKDAADQKHAPAATWLGWMLEKGIGTEADFEAALELYKMAANLGYPPAQKAKDRLADEPLASDDHSYF
jgi:TPR repeat protein